MSDGVPKHFWTDRYLVGKGRNKKILVFYKCIS